MNDNFVVGIIALDFLQDDFTLAIAHLGMSHAGLAVHVPRKRSVAHCFFLKGNRRIELGENVSKSGLLLLADAGIKIHHDPKVLAGAPVAAKIPPEPDLGAIQFSDFVIALVPFEDEGGAAEMLLHMVLTPTHMVRGVGVEVAGTE